VTKIGTSSANALSDAAKLGTKLLTGGRLLHALRDVDVEIATTPKDLVWTQDKVSLFHFRPLADQQIGVPVLICYGLVGRWTMTDLQEDRSLVRNLLNLGIDLYVVDWGNPSRADRYLTLDDYILGYLDGCVAEIAKRAGTRRVNLLGVCEGGVFATALAALEPARVNTLTLTITPIDFHADTVEDRPGHGFINIWTRSISAEDVDRFIDANGNLPGEFMGAIFNQMSPIRSLLKYNLDLLEIVDDESRLLNWLRMEKWIADRPGEAAKQWLEDLYQQNTTTSSPPPPRVRWGQKSARPTTPSWHWLAAISACSSAADRGHCSRPPLRRSWGGTTRVPHEQQDRLAGRGSRHRAVR
jgi:polyhydroxyalkanoate synthase